MRLTLFLSALALALGIGGSLLVPAECAVAAAVAATPTAVPAVAAPRPPETGEDTTLAALLGPDRFAWPARFTCRPHPNRPEVLTVVGQSFDELNETLAAADIFLEDCRGGFAIESLAPQDGKLDRIFGEASGEDI